MGFDSYIAGVVYCVSDVMIVIPDHFIEVGAKAAYDENWPPFRGKESEWPDTGLSVCADEFRACSRACLEASLPLFLNGKHPTAMTPDELLDFAMRFVEESDV